MGTMHSCTSGRQGFRPALEIDLVSDEEERARRYLRGDEEDEWTCIVDQRNGATLHKADTVVPVSSSI